MFFPQFPTGDLSVADQAVIVGKSSTLIYRECKTPKLQRLQHWWSTNFTISWLVTSTAFQLGPSRAVVKADVGIGQLLSLYSWPCELLGRIQVFVGNFQVLRAAAAQRKIHIMSPGCSEWSRTPYILLFFGHKIGECGCASPFWSRPGASA